MRSFIASYFSSRLTSGTGVGTGLCLIHLKQLRAFLLPGMSFSSLKKPFQKKQLNFPSGGTGQRCRNFSKNVFKIFRKMFLKFLLTWWDFVVLTCLRSRDAFPKLTKKLLVP